MLADARSALEQEHGAQVVASMAIVPMDLSLIEEKTVESCPNDKK